MKTTLEKLKEKVLFWKPEFIICQNFNYELIAELDLFNNHIEFFIKNTIDSLEKGHTSNITEAVEYFYNKIKIKEK